MAAEDGTGLARVAGRLLRAVLLTAGLVALGWLLSALFTTGSAAAEPTLPSDEPGLIGDLTQVLTGSAQTVAVTVHTPPPPAEPVITAPPAAPVTTPSTPAPAVAPHPRKPAHHAVAPARKAVHPAPPPKAPRPADQPQPAAAATPQTGTVPGGRVSDRDPAPDRTPTAPTAPTSTVSAGHGGPGEARGGSVPTALAEPTTSSASLVRLDRAGTATSRTAGLPAMSPD